jgi:hypothetical protein
LSLVGSGIIIILPMTDAALAATIGTAAAAAPSSTPAECVTRQAGEKLRMVTITEMPGWVQSTPDFVRYFLKSNYYYNNNMCGSEKTESRQ